LALISVNAEPLAIAMLRARPIVRVIQAGTVMARTYLASSLAADQIRLVFPLLSIVVPGLTEDRWKNYAEALIDEADRTDRCGIVTIKNARGAIHGLSAYALKPDLHKGRILVVENFAVIDLVGTGRAAKELLESLESIARKRGCSCISVGLLNPWMRGLMRDPDDPKADLFKVADYRGESLRFRRCF